MGGLDELVDNVDSQHEEEQARSILDELDIDSKEELENFEDRLDDVQHSLLHYDKRMEELEQQVEAQRELLHRLIKFITDELDSTNDNRPSDGQIDDRSRVEENTKTDSDTGLNF